FGPVCRRRWTTGQRRTASVVNGQWELPIDGHENCPAAATISACLETLFSLVLSFWLVETASPLRISVPEPLEGRHEITQPHVSDGPLKTYSRGTDPVTGCRSRNRGSGGGAAGSEDGPLKPCGWTTVSLSALCVPRRRRTASSSVRDLTRPSQRFSDSRAHDRHSLHTKACASAATLTIVPGARSGPTAAAPRLQQACRGEVIQTQRGAQQLNC